MSPVKSSGIDRLAAEAAVEGPGELILMDGRLSSEMGELDPEQSFVSPASSNSAMALLV